MQVHNLQVSEGEHLKTVNGIEPTGILKEQPSGDGTLKSNLKDPKRRRKSRAELNWRTTGNEDGNASSSDNAEVESDEESADSESESGSEQSAVDANQAPLWS